jgi:hypothetical protein
MPIVIVKEQRAVVIEVTYEVEIPEVVDLVEDLDFEIEDHLDRSTDEVDRETVRSNVEIIDLSYKQED